MSQFPMPIRPLQLIFICNDPIGIVKPEAPYDRLSQGKS